LRAIGADGTGLNEADLQSLFQGEGFARLVMAEGGVPRDVLSLFLEARSSLQGEPIGKVEVRGLSRPNPERRIRALLKNVPEGAEEQLRALPAEEGDKDRE
jgi:hypothetical protein